VIDWTFFFTAWELKGRYPQILDHPRHGGAARELFEHGNELLDTIVADGSIQARGVYGFWPAQADADDIVLDNGVVLPMLRQQVDHGEDGRPNRSLADFVAPPDAGLTDHIGGFAVTAGIGADEVAKSFEADLDDYHAIMVQALADRLAEAFAEWLHREARRAWYAADESLDGDDLVAERYRGIRPAFGYPACPWGAGKGITEGFNDLKYHDELVKSYEEVIPLAAKAVLTQIICFSGNRRGISDEQGIENCAKGLKRLMPTAEKYKVTMSMELLNSKVNHKDYQCDHTEWGVELCKVIGSDRFKLLYDIYHMQIMEGDVIATINKYHPYISHYHTGGVPGRNEIDETQELYYPAIMQAILKTGYKGYVAQEFVPKREDKIASLEQGVKICDVV
jgi:hydroxypyruvate isomerase